MKNLLIYDTEIINLIDTGKEAKNRQYSYCNGWRDFKNMGISVIGTWRNFDLISIFGKNFIIPLPLGKYQAFVNWEGKQKASEVTDFRRFYRLYCLSHRLIGFNSIAFDDKLLTASKMPIQTDFDLLCEVREKVGMPRQYVAGVTRGGYNLNNLALKNLGVGKTGTGALAPQLWQDGNKKEVIDYCINDVRLLKQLYFKFVNGLLRDSHSGKLF